MENKKEIIETMQNAVDAENMMHFCSSHLTSLIRNGRIKNKFSSFSESSKNNRDFLVKCLSDLGVDKYFPEEKCKFCNIKAESFSLLGAVNLGLEVTDAAIKTYKKLLELSETSDDKKKFKEILKEKDTEKASLKEEKKFISKEECKENFIESYCIPEVVSKLWK